MCRINQGQCNDQHCRYRSSAAFLSLVNYLNAKSFADLARQLPDESTVESGSADAARSVSDSEFLPERRRQRRVLFADEAGLELEQVKVVDKWITDANNNAEKNVNYRVNSYGVNSKTSAWLLSIRKTQSITIINLESEEATQKLREQSVILTECLYHAGATRRLTGYIWVKNVSIEKFVFVHYSVDNCADWQNFAASYWDSPCNEFDVFEFDIHLPADSNSVQFCIGYRCMDNNTLWDNCNAKNYQCRFDEENDT